MLVVDDDAFVRLVLERQLRNLGARVRTVDSGDSARQAMREPEAFDIVLCDLKMPGVDGVELLRDFAATHGDTALVLMSSCDARTLAAVEQLAQARGLALLGCLAKPIGTQTLKALLAGWRRGCARASRSTSRRVA